LFNKINLLPYWQQESLLNYLTVFERFIDKFALSFIYQGHPVYCIETSIAFL